jgi:hypothetical protein
MGGSYNDPLRVDFGRHITLEFHGSTITSDAGQCSSVAAVPRFRLRAGNRIPAMSIFLVTGVLIAMVLTRLKVVKACLLAAGLGTLALQMGVNAQTPARDTAGTSPSLEELAKMAAIVKPKLDEEKWQNIPWITDVKEGQRLAKEEKRPILLWTILGEPLDEC